MWIDILINLQWLCIIFFVGINLGYLILISLTFFNLPKYVNQQILRNFPKRQSDFSIPISIVVACYNEEGAIAQTVLSLLQIDYPEFEIIIVNDGSKDESLKVLIEEFDMVSLPLAVRQYLPHKPIRGLYQSRKIPNLRVVDKENAGSKADALNAGIDATIYSLFCPLDGDTMMDKDSLTYLVQPYQENPLTIASGGAVRIVNGCQVSDGVLVEIGTPKNLFALFQLLEYMRAFHYVRVGWSAVNAVPLISGAIGLFKKEAVYEVNGYNSKTHAEDLELTLRLHLHYSQKNVPYHIANSAKAVCWTEVPETYEILKRQRVRWQKGFIESMWMNRKLTFFPRSGVIGWIGMPFQFIFEGISPFIELFGYAITILSFFLGLLSYDALFAFLLLAFGLGYLITFITILIEEMLFKTYHKTGDLLMLFLAAILENFGYRQVNALWRCEGLVNWLRNVEGIREMPRLNTWQAPKKEV
jgi:cellulose synthase/poly-beta-1,6-N-acetylglucosamine synthase-like glycosyltransferase